MVSQVFFIKIKDPYRIKCFEVWRNFENGYFHAKSKVKNKIKNIKASVIHH